MRHGLPMSQGLKIRHSLTMRYGLTMKQSLAIRHGLTIRHDLKLRYGLKLRHGLKWRHGQELRRGIKTRYILNKPKASKATLSTSKLSLRHYELLSIPIMRRNSKKPEAGKLLVKPSAAISAVGI